MDHTTIMDKTPIDTLDHEKYTPRAASDEKVEVREAQVATAKEHSLTLRQSIRAYPKAIGWSILLSSAVIMEGYDTLLVSRFGLE